MKTVQAHLKEVNREQLIQEYLYDNPIHLQEVQDDTLTIQEAKDRIKKNLQKYIERLCTLPIEPSEDSKEYILFAHKVLKNGYHEIGSSLVCTQELKEKGEEAETYGYMFMKQAEIMGYLIADNEFTQQNLYEVLTDVLEVASFFGFEQEHLEEELQKLDESIKESEEGNAATYSMEDLRTKLGISKEGVDETADALKRNAWKATYEYDSYCKRKEMKKLCTV